MTQCSRCKTHYGEQWEANGGCPACQGVISYPSDFYMTSTYKLEKEEERRSKVRARLDNFNGFGEPPTFEKVVQIAMDWIVVDWRDGCAHDWIGQFLALYDGPELRAALLE
jgi:hypothetical protein